MTPAATISALMPAAPTGVKSRAVLPADLLQSIARLGPSLVLVHFPNVSAVHPIQRGSRAGNLAGRLSRELVAAQLGAHLETIHGESFRTYVFRVGDTAPGVAALVSAVNRVGLCQHAQIFSVAAPGSPVIVWPLPANKHRSSATPFCTKPEQGLSPHATRRDSFPSLPRWLGAFLQRLKTGLSALIRALAGKSYGAQPLPPATRHEVELRQINLALAGSLFHSHESY